MELVAILFFSGATVTIYRYVPGAGVAMAGILAVGAAFGLVVGGMVLLTEHSPLNHLYITLWEHLSGVHGDEEIFGDCGGAAAFPALLLALINFCLAIVAFLSVPIGAGILVVGLFGMLVWLMIRNEEAFSFGSATLILGATVFTVGLAALVMIGLFIRLISGMTACS